MEKKSIVQRKLKGVVVSDAMDKTRVVAVDRVKKHPRYHRYFTVTQRYKAHDEKNQTKKGDQVTIIHARPYSKEKRWRILSTHTDTNNA